MVARPLLCSCKLIMCFQCYDVARGLPGRCYAAVKMSRCFQWYEVARGLPGRCYTVAKVFLALFVFFSVLLFLFYFILNTGI